MGFLSNYIPDLNHMGKKRCSLCLLVVSPPLFTYLVVSSYFLANINSLDITLVPLKLSWRYPTSKNELDYF